MAMDNSLFHQYISGHLLSLPAFFGLLVALALSPKVDNIHQGTSELKWSTNSAGPQIEKKILDRCTILKISMILQIISCAVNPLIFTIPFVGDEDEYIHPIKICRVYAGPLFQPMLLFFQVAALGLAYGLAFCTVSTTYLGPQIYFQLYLLNEHLSRISEGYEDVNENELIYDEEYQDTIYKRLTLCCNQHVNLLKLGNIYVAFIKLGMLLIPMASIPPVTAAYFVSHHISPPSNFRMIPVMIELCIGVTNFCVTGQHVEDQSEELFNIATQCPWVYWNKKNRQMLLLILQNTTKPMQAASYASITINFRLLLLLYKWGYSLATLLY